MVLEVPLPGVHPARSMRSRELNILTVPDHYRWRPVGSRWLAGMGLLGIAVASFTDACAGPAASTPVLRWYVFREPSGAFAQAADSCSRASGGAYEIRLAPLPADADEQRTQLVRRLAAGDSDIDLIGMDVIWTAEFAEAGWILPWKGDVARQITRGRLSGPVQSARYRGQVWGAPFTSNAQLLWYRSDRVAQPPRTWDEMIDMAESLGEVGTIEAQGEQYEGLTVFFVSLLASAGGSVLSSPDSREDTVAVSLPTAPALAALRIMHRLATSSAADPALESSRENEARLAFETGDATFMVNYTFVWPSAQENAPEIAAHMAWAPWPRVDPDRPSRVTVGGVNLGVAAYSRDPALAFRAAVCLASPGNQKLAAIKGGLAPTTADLYDDPEVRRAFPFADLLRETLETAVQRPQTPLYSDISLAISRTLHPLSEIEAETTLDRLRRAVDKALHSEGLF